MTNPVFPTLSMMDECITAVQEIEQALSDIEQRICRPIPPQSRDEHIRIIWHCVDVRGLPVLLGAIASPEQPGIPAHPAGSANHAGPLPPVMLSWGEHPRLTVTLQSTGELHPTPTMEQAGITGRMLKRAADSGTLEAGAELSGHWHIDAPEILLGILVDMTTCGWCADISAITFTAPLERLRHLDIGTGSLPDGTPADALWIVLPARELTGGEKSRLTTRIAGSGATTACPFLDLSGWNAPDTSPGSEYTLSIETIIHAHEALFPPAENLATFPVLPVAPPSGTEADMPSGYMRDCMNLAWGATMLAAGETAAMKRTLDDRYHAVLDAVLAPPASICGLLRQKTHLEKLRSLPDMQVTPPRHEPFEAMRARGIAAFAAAAAGLAEQTAAEHAEHRTRRTAALLSFLTPLQSVMARHDEAARAIASLIGDARENRLPDDAAEMKRLLASVDTLLDSFSAHLGDETAAWKKKQRDSSPVTAAIPAEVLQQETEAAEQHRYTWETLIRLDLNKIHLKVPQEEMRQIVAAAGSDFLDYLNLTPADEKEFNRCLTAKWPNIARKYTKKAHTLMEDTCQLWEIAVNQKLDKIEEYRREHSPRSPGFPVDIVLRAHGKPAIADTLKVKLRKPALTAKLFNKQEKGLWRTETLMTIQKAADVCFKDFQASAMTWFDMIGEQIEAVRQRVFAIADGIVQTERNAVEQRNRSRADKLRTLTEEHERCTSRLAELTKKKQLIDDSRAAWIELRETLHDTESAI